MRQKSMSTKSPAEKVVRDIRRKTRKQYSAEEKIRIILAANYFDEHKVKTVADRTGAEAVVVPLFVVGAPGTDTYFTLFDYWVNGLVDAAKKTGVVSG